MDVDINALVQQLGQQIGQLTVEATAQRLRADAAEIALTELRATAGE